MTFARQEDFWNLLLQDIWNLQNRADWIGGGGGYLNGNLPGLPCAVNPLIVKDPSNLLLLIARGSKVFYAREHLTSTSAYLLPPQRAIFKYLDTAFFNCWNLKVSYSRAVLQLLITGEKATGENRRDKRRINCTTCNHSVCTHLWRQLKNGHCSKNNFIVSVRVKWWGGIVWWKCWNRLM